MPAPVLEKFLRAFSNYRAVLLVSALLLLVIGAYRGSLDSIEAQEGSKTAQRAASTQSAPSASGKKSGTAEEPEAKDGVAAKGYLSRDSAWWTVEELLGIVHRYPTVRFWITVKNGTNAPITGLRITDFYAPGFDRPQTFWGGCTGATWDHICSTVPAGASVTLWGDLLISDNAASRENAYAVLLWDAKDSPAQSSVIALGEIERLSWLGAWWRRLSQPDIGLPALAAIVLAFFTWLGKRKEKREADAKKAHEDKEKIEKEARDRKDKAEAEERDQYQRTWDLMLSQAYTWLCAITFPWPTRPLPRVSIWRNVVPLLGQANISSLPACLASHRCSGNACV